MNCDCELFMARFSIDFRELYLYIVNIKKESGFSNTKALKLPESGIIKKTRAIVLCKHLNRFLWILR